MQSPDNSGKQNYTQQKKPNVTRPKNRRLLFLQAETGLRKSFKYYSTFTSTRSQKYFFLSIHKFISYMSGTYEIKYYFTVYFLKMIFHHSVK